MSDDTRALHSRNLSMGEYLKRRYHRVPRRFACQARNEQEWRAWSEGARRALYELMAPWPERCPLDPHVRERTARDGYVREKVLFSSEEDMSVSAYLLIPTSDPPAAAGRYPAVVCQHGHGYGKDDVAGISHGVLAQWTALLAMRYAYGDALARLGYVVMAMDARGFGERASGYPVSSGEDGCNTVQLKAQLLGLNMLTLNVFDLMRCLDYLQGRLEVDSERVGCAGLSYGGTLTLFAAALDERIRVAIVSGYLGSLLEQTFTRGDTCGQQVVPNLLSWGELADVACLIAPRALLIESGTEDGLFGIEAARAAYSHVHRLYAALKVPQSAAHHIFQGGHRWDGEQAEAWLGRWL
jgi:dienelactone hydrolase